MGKAHSLAYAAMPMFFWPAPAVPRRLVIAELGDEAAREAAQRYGYERSTGDWRAGIDDPGGELVDIPVAKDAQDRERVVEGKKIRVRGWGVRQRRKER